MAEITLYLVCIDFCFLPIKQSKSSGFVAQIAIMLGGQDNI